MSIGNLNSISIFKSDDKVYVKHGAYAVRLAPTIGEWKMASIIPADANRVPLKTNGDMKLGRVVKFKQTHYAYIQEAPDDMVLSVWAAKTLRVGRASKSVFNGEATKKRNTSATKAEQERVNQGWLDTIAAASNHFPNLPHTRYLPGTVGAVGRGGSSDIELRLGSNMFVTWAKRGYFDYKTVDHVWSGTPWKGTTDHYKMGQAIAMHEIAHVIHQRGQLRRALVLGVRTAMADRPHGRQYKAILRRLIALLQDDLL